MIPEYTPEQQVWLMALGLTLVFLAVYVIVYRLGALVARRAGLAPTLAIVAGVVALAAAATTGLVYLAMWPVRARRRQVARLEREADEDARYLITGYRAVTAVRL